MLDSCMHWDISGRPLNITTITCNIIIPIVHMRTIVYILGVTMAEKIQDLEVDYPHVCLVVVIIQAETI